MCFNCFSSFFQDVCSIINLVLKMWKKKIKRFNSWMITKSQICNKCFFTQIWTKNKLARQRASYQTEFTDSLKATIQECQMRKTFFEIKNSGNYTYATSYQFQVSKNAKFEFRNDHITKLWLRNSSTLSYKNTTIIFSNMTINWINWS